VALEPIIQIFKDDIDNGEFNIAALDAGDHACDWAYSIGLNRLYGHPELLIVGLDATFTGMLLEHLGNQVASGMVIEPGDEIEVADGLTLRAQPVDELFATRGDWFSLGQTVMETWGARWPQTIQLLWCDGDGRYPEEPHDNGWMLRQPLLSVASCNV